MSDTPRTDGEAVDITYGVQGRKHLWTNPKGPFVRANFARELERENAALRGALNEIKACAPLVSVFHHIMDNALARKEAKP